MSLVTKVPAAVWLQDEADIYPDFVMISKGFGVPSRRVIKKEELRDAIREMLDTPGPYLLEVGLCSSRFFIKKAYHSDLLATYESCKKT